MSCERFRPAITDHACGAPLGAAAAAHLTACADCRHAFDARRALLARIDNDLEQLLSIEPSPDFAARAAAAAVRPAAMRRPMLTRWWIGAAAAAALAVTVYAGLSRQPHHEETVRVERRSDVHLPSVVRRGGADMASTTSAPRREAIRRPRLNPRETRMVRAAVAEPMPPVAPAPDLEVIVHPAQTRALARLHQMQRAGTLDGEQVPPPRTAVSDLTIAPLGVRLLAPEDPETVRPPSSAVDPMHEEPR
jgi:hypothetical protein